MTDRQKLAAKVLVTTDKVAPSALVKGNRIVYAGEAFRYEGVADVEQIAVNTRRVGIRIVNEVAGFPMIVPMDVDWYEKPWLDLIVG